MPNRSTREAAWGTFAHEIAAATLNNVQPVERWLGKKRIVDDEHEIECDQEMVDAVKAAVMEIDDELMPNDDWWVDWDLTPELSKLDPDFGGTADFARYRKSKKHLRVVDFKFGSGVIVEVVNNKQLKKYALGALLKLQQPCSKVTVVVIQPRAEHIDGRVREWTFPAVELMEFAAELKAAAVATRQPDAPLVPDPQVQCKFCPAKVKCPALKDRQTALAAAEFSEPSVLTPEKIAEALSLVPAVLARCKAIESAAYEMATRGTPIPGYKLVAKRPTRKWRSEGDVIMWAQQNAVDPYEPRSVKSPAQLEQQLYDAAPKGAKAKAKEVLAPFIESVSSGTTLVPADDNRPEQKRITGEAFTATAVSAKSGVDFF